MYFVGRAKETQRLSKAFREGKNVLLAGKYGIGRTSLARHVATLLQDQYRPVFLDNQETPAALCLQLLIELDPDHRKRWRQETPSYRASRALLRGCLVSGVTAPLIVMDNLAKITRPKLEFFQLLSWNKRCRFLLITESFLPAKDLFQLRSHFAPLEDIHLQYLSLQDVREYYRYYSATYSLGWGEEEIEAHARTVGGYPLNMAVVIQREMERRKVDTQRR